MKILTFTLLKCMDKILCWNTRGLNQIRKQVEVWNFILSQHAGLVSLLETKVKSSNMGQLYTRMFGNWCFTSNGSMHPNGRIIVAWNPLSFDTSILAMDSQFIHCLVSPKSGAPCFHVTFIYAFNDMKDRLSLWNFLKNWKDRIMIPGCSWEISIVFWKWMRGLALLSE